MVLEFINYLHTYLTNKLVNPMYLFSPTPTPFRQTETYPHPLLDMETLLDPLPDGRWRVTVRSDGYQEEGMVFSQSDVRAAETRLMQTIYRRAQQDFFGDSAPCDI